MPEHRSNPGLGALSHNAAPVIVTEIPLDSGRQCEFKQVASRDPQTGEFVPLERQRKATVLITQVIRVGGVATLHYLSDGLERSTSPVRSIKSMGSGRGIYWEVETGNSRYVLTPDKVDPPIERRKTFSPPEMIESIGVVTKRAAPGEAFVEGKLRTNGIFYAQYALKRGQDAIGLKIDGDGCSAVVCDGVGGHRKSGEFAEFFADIVKSLNREVLDIDIKKMIAQRVADFVAKEKELQGFDRRKDDSAFSTVSLLVHRGDNIFDLHQIGGPTVYVYDTKKGAIRVSYKTEKSLPVRNRVVGAWFDSQMGWSDNPQYSVRQIKVNDGEIIILASSFFSDNMATDTFYTEKAASLESKMKVVDQLDGATLRRLEKERLSIAVEQKLFESFLKEGEHDNEEAKKQKRLAWIGKNLSGRSGLEEVEKRFRVYAEQNIFKELVERVGSGAPLTADQFKKICKIGNAWSTKDASIVIIDPVVINKLSATAAADRKFTIKK